MSTSDITLLLTRAVSGERAAQEHLLLTQHETLTAYLRPRLPAKLQGQVGVEDIVQETFIRAFCAFASLDIRSGQEFAGWLKKIAQRCLADATKSIQAKKRGGDRHRTTVSARDQQSSLFDLLDQLVASGPTPSTRLRRAEGIQALRVALAGLPDDQRRAIQLRHVEQRSLEEVATELGCSADAARGLVYRAKQKLRDSLGRASQFLSSR